MNTTLRKFSKNAKALSPVVASIILIAVTVAVSVVVAAWMGGMSIGLMGNAEQATITNLGFASGDTIVVAIGNTGNSQVTITNAYVNTAVVGTTGLPMNVAKTSTGSLNCTYAWVSGIQYEVKLTTSKGNNLVLTAFAP